MCPPTYLLSPCLLFLLFILPSEHPVLRPFTPMPFEHLEALGIPRSISVMDCCPQKRCHLVEVERFVKVQMQGDVRVAFICSFCH